MPANDDVWVIVPTYNEAEVVRRVIEQLRQHFPNVVGVDDGSKDASAAEILAGGARLVRHPMNLGAGAALQTGLEFACWTQGPSTSSASTQMASTGWRTQSPWCGRSVPSR